MAIMHKHKRSIEIRLDITEWCSGFKAVHRTNPAKNPHAKPQLKGPKIESQLGS